MNTTTVGQKAEAVAREFLEARGMRCLAANARTRFYELDLVMLEGQDIVAVEVKYRKNHDFGGGEAAISRDKARRLRQAVLQWAAQNGYDGANQNLRIDVVIVTGAKLECVHYPCAVDDG
jgi:putative endonuclease